MINKNQSPSRVKFRLIVGAIFVAAFITACPNPDQLMDARINDFLDDLSDFETGATSANQSLAERIVNRHIHPGAEDRDAARFPAYWENSQFDPFDATSYSWSLSNSQESSSFSGTNRRSGTVTRTGAAGGSITAVFFMKQSGSDWLIRAIDDGGDGNLLQNIR